MRSVEVDACGLDKKLAVEIVRRAMAIAGSCPVIVTIDSAEACESIRRIASSKRRFIYERRAESGLIILELTKHPF